MGMHTKETRSERDTCLPMFITMPISRRMDKEAMIHIHNGILLNGNDNPICKTEKETQMYRTDFGTLTALKQIYYQGLQLIKINEKKKRLCGCQIYSFSSFFSLLCQQFYAMFLKRATYSWRNWMMMLSIQILVPLVILSISLSFLNFDISMDNSPLELTLKLYGQTIVPVYISPNSRLGPQFVEHLTDVLVAEGQIPLELQSPVEAFLLKKLEEEPEVFDQNYLVAISFDDMGNHTIVTAMFNNQAYHSMAQVLALVDNVLFKLLSGPQASITVLNHPQPQSSLETAEDILYEGPKGHYLVINLLFGMAFLSSSFSILTVKERGLKAKQVQFISGVHVATFWLSSLLWDLLSFLVPSLLLLVVFLYFNEDAFTHKENVPAVFLMLMLYAWAIIPFIYLTSFCFDNAGNACVKLIIMLTFLSIGPFVLVSVTSEKELGYTTISDSLDDMFLLLPGHCLGMALSNLYYNFELQKFCKAKSLDYVECSKVSEGYVVQEDIYAWKSLGMGKYLTALAISGLVYLILLFLIETNVLWELKVRFSGLYWKQKLVVLQNAKSVPGDQDVEEEANMIKNSWEDLCKKNPLVLKELSKVKIYSGEKTISLTSGAGKTNLNTRPETIKLLEENIGKTLSNINHSRILYDPPPRILDIKAKISKWDLI
ncbi:hypothetical protein FD754_023838, partial [Muntiacus muntjak]